MWNCKVCDLEMPSNSRKLNLKKSTDNKIDIVCSIHKFFTNNLSNLRRYMKISEKDVKEKITFKCTKCEKEFGLKKPLNQHNKSHKNSQS